LTRTSDEEEYEESFNALVTQPYLRAMMSSLSMEKTYKEIIGKLARYKNMNPQLTLNIVMDTHFMVSIAIESDEEKREDKIENKFVDIANQLQNEKEKLGNDIKQKDTDIKSLQEKVSNIERKIEKNEKNSQEQVDKLKDKIEEEKNLRKKAEKEAKTTKNELKDFKKLSAKRWLRVTIAIFIFLELIVGAFSILYGSGDNAWQKLISSCPFFSIPLVISVLLGWLIIGREKLRLLGWPWNKIFKIEK